MHPLKVQAKNKIKNFGGFCFMTTVVLGLLGCEDQPPAPRDLRRRVQLHKIDAPKIQLPPTLGVSSFDFGTVANLQMIDVLRRTQTFSSAGSDPNASFDPTGLKNDEQDRFNQCGDTGPALQQFDLLSNAPIYSEASMVSKDAACLINYPQAVIEGSIVDFQFKSQAGLAVGLKDIPFLNSLSFDVSEYQLDMIMMARAPLEQGNHYLSTTTTQSYARKWNASLKMDLGFLTLGPQYYYQTPLAQMVDEGLTTAVSELRDNWSTGDPWYAMVLRSCDKYIYINGGASDDSNLEVGDIVRIVNVKYFWEGEVCKSWLQSEIQDQVVAYARITSLGRNMAEAAIIQDDPAYPNQPGVSIHPGARVYMEKNVEQVNFEQQQKQ